MAADPIVYCLEHLTDYDQFERLCHDLMALEGYSKIEPLGGSKDKGRDALHSDSIGATNTVFAYSVREDWKMKLGEDAKKIKKYGHSCHTMAFLCTAHFSSSERDEAVRHIKDAYGWDLALYGLERLRTLLVGPHSKLLIQHPQIFTPALVRSVTNPEASRTVLIIDHHLDDAPFATWLARRLAILGYEVWCKGVSPTGGGPWGDQVLTLLESTAFRHLAVLSPSGCSDPDLTVRRGLAAAANRLVPLRATVLDELTLDSRTRTSEFVDFTTGWAVGLLMLTKALERANCPHHGGDVSISFIGSLAPPDVLSSSPETICSNRFPITQVPELVRRFVSDKQVSLEDFKEFRTKWACRRVDPNRFLSFTSPPSDLNQKYMFRPVPGAPWDNMTHIDNIAVASVIPELIRKSIEVHYASLGLKYCQDRHLLYFPADLVKNDRLSVLRLNKSKSVVGCVGQRKHWTPKASTIYKYFLAPVFSVNRVGDTFMLLVRPRVRLTDENGVPLAGRTVNSRRKHLCKGWWNDDWLHRILGIVQFASKDGVIAIGTLTLEQIRIESTPEIWSISPSINEEALNRKEIDREEALAYLAEDEDSEVAVDDNAE